MRKIIERFERLPLTRQFLVIAFVTLFTLLVLLNGFIYHSFKTFFISREQEHFTEHVTKQLKQQLRLFIFRRQWSPDMDFSKLMTAFDGMTHVIDIVFYDAEGKYLYSRSGVPFDNRTLGENHGLMKAVSGDMHYEIHKVGEGFLNQLVAKTESGFVQEFYFPFIIKDEVKGVIEMYRDFSHELHEINDIQMKASVISFTIFVLTIVALYFVIRKIEIRQERMKDKVMKLEKLSYLGEFSSKMAHEIGNPMHVIMGNIEMLEEVLEEDPFVEKRLKIVSRQLNKIQNIIRNYLFVAKEPIPELKPFPLQLVVEQVLEDMTHTVGDHIHLRSITDEVTVLSDRNFVEQVLYNFIKNASDSMGDKQGQITVTARVENQQMTVSVHDTGEGVPEELREKIFDPFFTTKKTGKGTGLGLSVCADLVHALGGTIHCESKPGDTTFSFNVPVKVEEVQCVY